MAFREIVLQSWRKPNVLTVLLWPLSLFYRLAFWVNKSLYEHAFKQSYRAPVPVIVVGNITVGGTGKTPLVIYLVEQLIENGFKPAVISRGYGGHASDYPLQVTDATAVELCGDEPALIVRRTGVPLCVGPDRRACIQKLLATNDIDIIISDDGLQHFALQRDIELCLQDDTADIENTCLLPAGPYREAVSRLSTVDTLIRHVAYESPVQSGDVDSGDLESGELESENVDSSDLDNDEASVFMSLQAQAPRPVVASNRVFDGAGKIAAVAGIGNPQRFFTTCDSMGFSFEPHAFPDHHEFVFSDIDFADTQVLMTEKDAVKCQRFADDRHWYLPVDAKLSDGFIDDLIAMIEQVNIS